MTKLVFCLAVVFLGTYLSEAGEIKRSTRFGEFNSYFVYSRDNARSPERINPTVASANSQRNFRSKVVVLIHDHAGSATTTLNPTVKDALLTSEDVTVIVVDWSFSASQSYENALGQAPSVASGIYDLLRVFVTANKVSLARLHLVGFGLGAHIAAITARELKAWRGDVARITGLDPAARLTSNLNRLRSDDASYVEVIHTDTVDGDEESAIGIADALGHIDFYPNGGTAQPGCENAACNHKRAWELFAASLTHPLLFGNQCDADAEINAKNCRGFKVALGNNANDKYGQGKFYLVTGDIYPYDEVTTTVDDTNPTEPEDPTTTNVETENPTTTNVETEDPTTTNAETEDATTTNAETEDTTTTNAPTTNPDSII